MGGEEGKQQSTQPCMFHEDLKAATTQHSKAAGEWARWQAMYEEKMSTLINNQDQNLNLTKEVKKCVKETNLELARNYVGKEDMAAFIKETDKKFTTLNDKFAQAQKETNIMLWKVITLVFPAGALAFAVVAWLVDMIRVAGVM